MKTKDEGKIPLSLNIWKWYHILIMGGFTIFLIYALIFHRIAVINALTKDSSLVVSILGLIFYYLLSIGIIYGIIKKNMIGYYASLVYLLVGVLNSHKVLRYGPNFLNQVIVLILLVVGIFIFRQSSYFGIDLKKYIK